MSALLTLSIEHFVLVRRAQVEFAPGFTVVSGMTGAGKSLLLRALLFILGDRMSAADVRSRGEGKTRVEALFAIEEAELAEDLRRLGLASDWPGEELLLSRSMDRSGRSRAKINGRVATLSQLREVGRRLVSLLSQHEYQNLVDAASQARIVDRFGRHEEAARRFEEARRECHELRREIAEREEREARDRAFRERCAADLALLEELAPEEGEFEALSQEAERLKRAEDLQRLLYGALGDLSEGDRSVAGILRGVQRRLERELDALPDMEETLAAIDRAVTEIGEANRGLGETLRSVRDDPFRLRTVQERLAALRDTSRRLRVTAEDLAAEHERLAGILDSPAEAELGSLREQEAALFQSVLDQDRALTRAREEAARGLVERVQAKLADLGMEHAQFAIQVKADKPGDELPPAGGSGRVALQLAANPGDALRPLAEVASGGELSRVMLALQRHLGAGLDVALLVFDEVDQNVGGRLGAVIGEELAALAAERQVLVISHLPQVAAFADRHLLAEKTVDDESTETDYRELEGEERVRELAAMTRGRDITDAALAEARELLRRAEQTSLAEEA